MCCISTIFLVLISRIAIVVWWLTDPQRFVLAFKNWNLPGSFSSGVFGHCWALYSYLGRPWHISLSFGGRRWLRLDLAGVALW